jgi:hypothetical protein
MSYFQQFDNITLSELFPNVEIFKEEYTNSGLPLTFNVEGIETAKQYLSDDTLSTIYVLLMGRYADSTIKAYNTYGAFKTRFFTRIWQHGPTWKTKLDIQNKLRAMGIDDGSDIYKGGSAIYNSALNPSTSPSSQTLEELDYINSQNVTKYKKSKIEGLAALTELLKNDVTEAFLRRFEDLFKSIIYSGRTLLYESEGEL